MSQSNHSIFRTFTVFNMLYGILVVQPFLLRVVPCLNLDQSIVC